MARMEAALRNPREKERKRACEISNDRAFRRPTTFRSAATLIIRIVNNQQERRSLPVFAATSESAFTADISAFAFY